MEGGDANPVSESFYISSNASSANLAPIQLNPIDLSSSRPVPASSVRSNPIVAPVILDAQGIAEVERIRSNARERYRIRRDRETSAERDVRLARQRERRRARVELETDNEREVRRARSRVDVAASRSNAPILSQVERRVREVQRHIVRQERLELDLKAAAFSYSPQIDYPSHPLIDIGKMDTICPHCSARRFPGEAKGICCASGKVRLLTYPEPPEPLLSLYSGQYPESNHFLSHIRRYNGCFQMTSFGVTGTAVQDDFQTTFRIQGQIYHRIGSLLPLPDVQPRFMQIFFVGDTDSQIDLRCSLLEGVRRGLVANFQQLFDEHNHLIRSFRTALERMPSDEHRIVINGNRAPAGEHPGRYNAPSVDEIACIMVGDQRATNRDVVLYRRDSRLQRIEECHPSYDALQYPIMLWRGDDGYRLNLRVSTSEDASDQPSRSHKVTCKQFYSYHLMIRPDDRRNFLLKCRSLLNQYVVDMYAKIEAERLRFIRCNQEKLRRDDYIHLRDALHAQENPADIGQRVILPSTFIGSPRHMHEYAQDAMAYVRCHGRPDLFITFTCNSSWKEITDLFMTSQKAIDRNDIVARVFRQKLLKMIKVIDKHKLFGECKCYMYSIEWQKRGLPHAHILIWLADRIRPEQIDSIISAELPDQISDPILFGIVKKSMIHGPCGSMRPNSPCMDGQQCTKKYPRQFRSQTVTGIDGYPLYRRRSPEEGGNSVIIGEFTIDNSWVVPYCPVLSRMFDAHINVEYCNSVKSIKYICKYVNKGCDMASMRIAPQNQPVDQDEPTMYQLGRYINSNEAFWRIFEFEIHGRYPTVVHLAVHLENGQRIIFDPQNAVRVVERGPPETTLTAFFTLCRQDSFARTLLYVDVPRYYTWNKKKFERRKQGTRVEGVDIRASDAIGRIYTVHPSNSECFYLRMLLNKVPGPTSFEDLRRFEGSICATYREACQLRGLLECDTHWESTLDEAASTKMPAQLRALFCVIVSCCNPSNPANLWLKFKEHLSEDILMTMRRQNPTQDIDFTEVIFNRALIMIEDTCLAMCGKVLIELGLPAPNRSLEDPLNSEIARELRYDRSDLQEYVSSNLDKLVSDQRVAYDTIIDAIDNDLGGLFFIDAPGGTGKTFLINLILASVRQKGDIIIAVASSGIAATLLAGGRTAHSAFKLPLDLNRTEQPVCSISMQTAKAALLRRCKAIIWDECTMSHKKALEAVERSLRDVRRSTVPFGGVPIILAGDFRQTLPVVTRGTPADQLSACLKQSHLWSSVKKLHLRTNMRVHLRNEPGAETFARQLLSIGDGVHPVNPRTAKIRFADNFCTLVSSTEELIDRVFPDLGNNLKNLDWLFERAILASKNDSVDELNTIVQAKVSGQSRFYFSIDTTVDPEQAVHYAPEVLNSFSPPGFPPHKLELKVGSPIIMLRNLNPPKLCNGTRLAVKMLTNNLIQATILSGEYKGEDVMIPRIPLITSDLIVEFKRLQFPVRLAYGITINKSQGQSLKVVGINLTDSCFSHGQLYVACSRVGTPSNMFVLAPDGETPNIVYPLALQ